MRRDLLGRGNVTFMNSVIAQRLCTVTAGVVVRPSVLTCHRRPVE
jgi:hypothetical protein